LLILFFVVAPLVELAVFVQVSQWIGFLDAFGLLLVISVIGVLIVRSQGLGVWRRVRAQIRQGIVPTADLVNGLLILVAGLLLILPGFVSSVVGLLLLLPPVRAFFRGRLQKRYTVRAANHVVKVVNTRTSNSRATPSDAIEVLPPAARPLPPASGGTPPADQ
jgi:UPF0716 protein FxsA